MKEPYYPNQKQDELEAAKGIVAALCISFVSAACVVAILFLVKGGA